ncbi:hypothetical protein ABMX64_20020 [Vibrio vulnificus]|nr:hypothetical protein [Vibrio vulnificus]EIE1227680.1 hypothetical protein [Vibrio vulnificus]MDK2679261.1 hypothetical protein [Vibrio vulnificus]MDK2688010.1 hypothetical protein [Vibrio vulnificus]
MSHEQYTAISRTRLIDLALLPAGQLLQYVETKPNWMQKAILNLLAKGV